MTEPIGEHSLSVGQQGMTGGMGLDVRKYQHFDKEKAIELYLTHPKNVSLICRALGVNRGTWQYNLDHDPDFALAIHEIEEAHCDDLEATMLELGKAKSSFNFNDRIAYLRAHRPHLYNPTKRIIVEGYSMNGKERANRLAGVEGAIDAEVVKTYTTRKERLEAKRQAQLESGKGSAGDEKVGEVS